MLSAVLNTEQAILVSIAIMESFVLLQKRKDGSNSLEGKIDQLRNEFDQKLECHTTRILEVLNRSAQSGSLPGTPSIQSNFAMSKDHSKVQTIQAMVARYYCIAIQDLKISTRAKSVVLPRQVAI